MDGQTDSIYRASIALRGKNGKWSVDWCAWWCIGSQPGVMVAHKLKEAIRSKCTVVEAEEILLDLQGPMSESLGV